MNHRLIAISTFAVLLLGAYGTAAVSNMGLNNSSQQTPGGYSGSNNSPQQNPSTGY